MKKKLGIIILLLLLVGTVFPDTAFISNSSPSSLSDDIRIDADIEPNTTATELINSPTEYIVRVESENLTQATIFIKKSRVNATENAENLVAIVNGKQKQLQTSTALDLSWYTIDTDTKTTNITITPQALAGGGSSGIIEWIRLTFLSSPITILMGISFFLIIAVAVMIYFRRTAKVMWT